MIEKTESPGASLLASAPWLHVVAVRNPLALQELEQRLDAGESQAIALALELPANLLLIDEARGRRAAEARQLPVTGTLGTLVLAKTQGRIDRLQPLLDELIAAEFRMRPELYRAVLALAGEVDEFDAREKG